MCRKLCNIFEALQCKRQKQIYFDSSIIKLRISQRCGNLSNHFQDNQRVISPRLLSAQASNFKIWFAALKARQWASFLVLPCLGNCYLLGRNLDTKYPTQKLWQDIEDDIKRSVCFIGN